MIEILGFHRHKNYDVKKWSLKFSGALGLNVASERDLILQLGCVATLTAWSDCDWTKCPHYYRPPNFSNCCNTVHSDWGWKCPLEEEVSHPWFSHNSDTVHWGWCQCSGERDFCLSEYLSNEVYLPTTTAPGNLETAFSEQDGVTLKFQNLTS